MCKNTGRRIISLLLAVCLCGGASLPAFAAEGLDGQVSSVTSALEGAVGGVRLPSEGDPVSQPGDPSPSPSPAPDEEGPVSSQPEEEGEEAPPEEEPGDERNATPLLVTGGHDTYLSGYTGGYFKPNNAMTRAEVASMLYNLLAAKPPVTESKFTDVSAGSWYYTPVNSLAEAGVLTGSNGLFRPGDTISRAEFVTALSKCFTVETGTVTFTDVPESHWAYPYIASAVAKGWINGYSDGSFKPNDPILRCQAAKIMNVALDRHDDDYAKDRGQQKFVDVPSSHWAYLDIAEAAKPLGGGTVVDPPVDDHPIKNNDTVRVTATSGLNVRESPSTSAAIITAVIYGTTLTVTDTSPWPWVKVRLSNGRVGYVHSDYIEKTSGGNSGGDTPVTGAGAKLSTGTITLRQYQSFRLDASVTSGMDAMVWSSSDPSVAEVGYTVAYNNTEHGAMVYGKKPGTATLTFSDRAGSTKVSCTVTVTTPEAVRYAYTDANTLGAGVTCNLVGVTDTSRTAVRFDIVDGPGGGSRTATSYETKTRKSSYGLPDNTVRVFKVDVSFGMAGTYTMRAYSQDASGSFSTDYKEFTVLVTSSGNPAVITGDPRRASREAVDMIKGFEGDMMEIQDDKLNRKHPTVGHGYVVPVNTIFYNNLTDEEAYGMLVDQVNTGGYATAVERFRANNGIRMSQAQFDALVSFVYNLGPNVLDPSRYYTPAVILNAVVPPVDLSPSNPYNGTLNVGDGVIYSQSSLNSTVLATVPGGKSVSVTGYQRYSNDRQQEVWYRVSYGSVSGWMPAGYVRLNSSRLIHDLNYADSTVLANNFLQWHTANSVHYVGLIRRRMAECKMFFFANYEEANSSHPNYTKNTYGFVFPPCCKSYDYR